MGKETRSVMCKYKFPMKNVIIMYTQNLIFKFNAQGSIELPRICYWTSCTFLKLLHRAPQVCQVTATKRQHDIGLKIKSPLLTPGWVSGWDNEVQQVTLGHLSSTVIRPHDLTCEYISQDGSFYLLPISRKGLVSSLHDQVSDQDCL